jgi:hypothetical protein
MTPSVRILLPILSDKELDLFVATPADALLSSANLPALAEDAKVTFCILAPADIAKQFESTSVGKAIGRLSELLWISVNELVLDYPFEVVPSLAYQKGMTSCAQHATETAFIFLQPNLVLADGALLAISRRIRAGVRAVRASYLRVDRSVFEKSFTRSAVGVGFTPRVLVAHAVECLDLRDIGSFVNIDAPLIGSAERLIWRHDAKTILAYDFAKALIALWPTRIVTDACGFRDVAFADAMFPDGASYHFVDSDEFCAVEISEPAESATAIRLGLPSIAARARELGGHTTDAQRQSGIQFPVAFHADKLPSNLVRTRGVAESYVRRVVGAIGGANGSMLKARWTLAYYLWSVRSFELGRGPLPNGPFAELFAHFHGSQSAGNAVDNRPPLVRSSGKVVSLAGLLRWLQQRALGRVPLVSFFHPEWPEYRHVAPLLRQAARKPRTKVAYVTDGVGIFSRVLGQPDFTAVELADAKEDRNWAPAAWDIVILELSTAALEQCAALTMRALSSLRPGGRVVIYHRNVAGLSCNALNDTLKAFVKLGTRRIGKMSVSVVSATPYRRWLNDGFLLALKLARSRRRTGFAYAGALVTIVSALTAFSNILTGIRSLRDESSVPELCSSLTIMVPADEPVLNS